MENASKALIMAATVIISVMLFASFVFVFRAGGRAAAQYDEKQVSGQVQLFNSKFLEFAKDTNTVTDMVSVANLASSMNKESAYSSAVTVNIDIEIGDLDVSISPNRQIPKNYMFYAKSNAVNDTTSMIYAYDLFDIQLNEAIQLYKTDGTTASGNHIGTLDPEISPSAVEDEEGMLKEPSKDEDTLSMERHGETGTRSVYKYVFKNEDVRYQGQGGRISYMKFKAYLHNSEW